MVYCPTLPKSPVTCWRHRIVLPYCRPRRHIDDVVLSYPIQVPFVTPPGMILTADYNIQMKAKAILMSWTPPLHHQLTVLLSKTKWIKPTNKIPNWSSKDENKVNEMETTKYMRATLVKMDKHGLICLAGQKWHCFENDKIGMGWKISVCTATQFFFPSELEGLFNERCIDSRERKKMQYFTRNEWVQRILEEISVPVWMKEDLLIMRLSADSQLYCFNLENNNWS